MKRISAAIAAIVLTAASAQGTTFSTPTRIYAVSGVSDSGSSSSRRSATTVICTNLSGTNAIIKVAFFKQNGVRAGALQTQTVAHTAPYTVATSAVQVFLLNGLANTGEISQGMAIVLSTQSGVHCRAAVLDPTAASAQGLDLHMVRYNAHPGTVE